MRRIVSNSDDDLLRMFNSEFNDFATSEYDFYPAGLGSEIDKINKRVYERVNNGVYLAGFATAQRPYERAAKRLFETLDELDARLASQRYLLGQHMTESDWRLFPTLIRFDGLSWPLQMQHPSHRRLPEPLALPARPIPARWRRRDRELRPHQAPLLYDARQVNPARIVPIGLRSIWRASWPGAGR
jgi:glutathionyl-hydroquinone reductase